MLQVSACQLGNFREWDFISVKIHIPIPEKTLVGSVRAQCHSEPKPCQGSEYYDWPTWSGEWPCICRQGVESLWLTVSHNPVEGRKKGGSSQRKAVVLPEIYCIGLFWDTFVMQSKLMPVTTQHVSKSRDKVLGQGKQLYSEIHRPRRWWTDVLKHQLNSGFIASCFYARKGGKGEGAGYWVTEDCRHLGTSKI